MENKKKLLIAGIVSIIVLLISIILIMNIMKNNKSINIKLDTNYKTLVGLKVDSDIILVINQKDQISNIIYLNEKSVNHLANQKIEKKNISDAIELIVDKLKNNNEFDDHGPLHFIKYDDDIENDNILKELNKQFVIYGINNEIIEEKSSLDEKIKELNIEITDNEITTLYIYSKKLLKETK